MVYTNFSSVLHAASVPSGLPGNVVAAKGQPPNVVDIEDSVYGFRLALH